MNPATAKITAHEKPEDELIKEFCQNLQDCKTIDDAFVTITSLFDSLDVNHLSPLRRLHFKTGFPST